MVCKDCERWLTEFEEKLRSEERSDNTVSKYLRDAKKFLFWLKERPITKADVIAYKDSLVEEGYAPTSINSMLAGVNRLLLLHGLGEFCVKGLRLQRRPYSEPGRELTRKEYRRLIKAAHGDRRLKLVLEVICATGIRVSELAYFTVEAVEAGEVSVTNKGKTRVVLLPSRLKASILRYARARHIESGQIFLTKGGKPLDRSNIWHQMKALCKKAKVAATKVFPHNLRKLFARAFYREGKDISALADVLGHSSINTTRIYIRTTADYHRRIIDGLKLVL